MTARADGAAATRERLLTAAWRYFATRPYEDVRLSEIAADAEVTAQTLHTQFGSKEQLFTAVAMRWGLQEMARRDEAPVGQVREAIEILFDRYEANGKTVLRMLSEEERIPTVRRITDAGRSYHRDWPTWRRSAACGAIPPSRERSSCSTRPSMPPSKACAAS